MMKWHKGSVQKLINRFREFGTIYRKVGSGRPVTVTTAENEEIVEQLICSQDDFPGTHKSLREIEKLTGIKRTSVRKMAKRNEYKLIKTPRMNEEKTNLEVWCIGRAVFPQEKHREVCV